MQIAIMARCFQHARHSVSRHNCVIEDKVVT